VAQSGWRGFRDEFEIEPRNLLGSPCAGAPVRLTLPSAVNHGLDALSVNDVAARVAGLQHRPGQFAVIRRFRCADKRTCCVRRGPTAYLGEAEWSLFPCKAMKICSCALGIFEITSAALRRIVGRARWYRELADAETRPSKISHRGLDVAKSAGYVSDLPARCWPNEVS